MLKIIELFSDESWKEVKGKFIPAELLNTYFEKIENNFTEIRKWQNAETEISLTLERKWQKGELIPILQKTNNDLFLIKITFQKMYKDE